MYNPNKSYQEKYLKYKTKYLKLKKLVGGTGVDIKILVITFNQGHQDYINVDKIMALIQSNKNPEIVAISIQESKGKTLLRDTHILTDYARIITESMTQGSLGSMKLFIYQKNDTGSTKLHITHETSTSRCMYTDMNGLDKNGLFKGGIIAYLKIQPTVSSTNSTNLAIVCSHLPSDPAKPETRDACLLKLIAEIDKKSEYRNIIFTGDLNYRTDNLKEPTRYEKTTMVNICKRQNKDLIILDHDFANQSEEKADKTNKSSVERIPVYAFANQNLDGYTRADQLTSRLTGLTDKLHTTGLKESPKNFCPTCKLILHEQRDQKPNETNYDDTRFPSWCDRVLHKGPNLQPLKYDSINLSNESDHLAVYQLFTLTLNK
jgi:hypothetical protein